MYFDSNNSLADGFLSFTSACVSGISRSTASTDTDLADASARTWLSTMTNVQRHLAWKGGTFLPSASSTSLLMPLGDSVCHGMASLNFSGSLMSRTLSISSRVSVTLKTLPSMSPHMGHVRSSPIAKTSYSVIPASSMPETVPKDLARTSAALETTSQYL